MQPGHSTKTAASCTILPVYCAKTAATCTIPQGLCTMLPGPGATPEASFCRTIAMNKNSPLTLAQALFLLIPALCVKD